MLTGKDGAIAFLVLDASLEMKNFDIGMRDQALLKGFRQILFLDPAVKLCSPLNLLPSGGTNPATVFRHYLMGNYQRPQVVTKEVERPLLGIWGEIKARLSKSTTPRDDSCYDQKTSRTEVLSLFKRKSLTNTSQMTIPTPDKGQQTESKSPS